STVTFRLGYTDNKGYTDYQYFWIQTSDDLLTLNQNNMAVSASSNGRLGFVDESNAKGVGISSNGLPLIKEAGLLVGLNSQRVSNAVLSAPHRKHNHFKTLQTIRFTNKTLQTLSTTSSFSDSLAGNRQIGVNIRQQITQRINKPHKDYTIVAYTITNRTQQTIDSLSVGLYVDWDINNPKNNKANWDNTQQFGYVYDGVRYAGVKALGTQLLYYALDKEATNLLNIKDSFSTAEKWFTLNNGLLQKQAGYVLNGVGSDVAHVVGAKVMNLQVGEQRTLQFIIAAGNSYQDLYETMFIATAYLTGNAPKSPMPTIKTTLCSEDLTIRPQNGSNFNFYTANNLAEPLKTSSFLKVNLADSTTTYYISNVDSLIESSLVKYQFKVRSATAQIQSLDSINLFERQSIQFYAKADKGERYLWTFGDSKSSLLQNPLHTYTQKGNYTVTLQVTDSLGCKTVTSKTIKVVYLPRSPKPIISPLFQVCSKNPVVIAPTNGTNFKFYADEQLRKVLYIGKSFVVRDINIKQLYITNIDSALESFAAITNITRTVLDANFTTQPQADTVLFASVVFFDQSIGVNTIRRWSWNFGDGTTLDGKNVSHTFRQQGVYKVTLTVTDETGCSDVITKDFKVGRRSPYPIVTSKVVLCTPAHYVLAPQNGTKFNFFADATLQQKIGNGKTLDTFIGKSQFIYVVGIDSIVESAATRVEFLVQQPTVTIDVPAELKLFETNRSTFNAQSNVPVVQYLWDFGNGNVSSQATPTQSYTKQGNYPIKLTITDNLGCKTTVYKELKVVNRANSPLVAAYTACEGENLTIRPKGGSFFNFYLAPNTSPIASGASYTVNLRKPIDLYITCADSMVESLPTYTRIEISQVKADFTTNLDTLNVYEKDSLVVSVPNALPNMLYEWNINSTIYKGQKLAVWLPQTGTYTITLRAIDANGCSATVYKTIVVLNENTSALPPYKKLLVYPNPTREETKVELELRKAQEVSYQLYSTNGQLLQQVEKEYVKDKLYRLNCSLLPQGTYLLQINIGGKVEVRKIIIQ
ncbi:MAG: PKD domain-containing protein, partial [Thermoflexibacteraceae bacterium]